MGFSGKPCNSVAIYCVKCPADMTLCCDDLPQHTPEELLAMLAAQWNQRFDQTADPYQTEEYQKFVESMIPLCHCAEKHRPCDGVLAGGVCDGIQDDKQEPQTQEDL